MRQDSEIFGTVVLAVLVLGSSFVAIQTADGKPIDDAESYAVFASELSRPWPSAGGTKRPVLQQETVTNRSCMPSGGAFDTDWRPVRENFRIENAAERRILPDRQLGSPFIVVPAAEIRSLIRPPGFALTDFYRKYPESGGYLQVSAVGFDAGRNRTMVYIAYHCGPECASGRHHVLEKVDDAWREAPVAGMIQCETGS